MIKYVIKGRTKFVENKKDIYVGCTIGEGWGEQRGIFDKREDAIQELRNDIVNCISSVSKWKDGYEVTEYLIEAEERNEDGSTILIFDDDSKLVDISEETRRIIAISDMPDESEWRMDII